MTKKVSTRRPLPRLAERLRLYASVTWYTKALGLEGFRREPGRYVGLRSAGAPFLSGFSTGGRPDNPGALDHVTFPISDLDALTARADHLAAASIAHDGIKPNPYGHSAGLFDPTATTSSWSARCRTRPPDPSLARIPARIDLEPLKPRLIDDIQHHARLDDTGREITQARRTTSQPGAVVPVKASLGYFRRGPALWPAPLASMADYSVAVPISASWWRLVIGSASLCWSHARWSTSRVSSSPMPNRGPGVKVAGRCCIPWMTPIVG